MTVPLNSGQSLCFCWLLYNTRYTTSCMQGINSAIWKYLNKGWCYVARCKAELLLPPWSWLYSNNYMVVIPYTVSHIPESLHAERTMWCMPAPGRLCRLSLARVSCECVMFVPCFLLKFITTVAQLHDPAMRIDSVRSSFVKGILKVLSDM